MTNEGPILLVEDNPDDVELAQHAFRTNKIANHVIVKQDGVAALAYLFDVREPLPSVVLLDLKLPKLSGIEVLREIRLNERTRLTPVVVLTTSREERDLVDSYTLGANSYIVKPVDFTQFVEAVKNLGMYWLLLNEAPPLKEHAHGEAPASSRG